MYIYATSLVFMLFGTSEFTLRLTSVLFFAGFLAGVTRLTFLPTERSHPITWYTLLAAGFLPWFFTLSRIAFEVIAQLTVTVWMLYCLYQTYHVTVGRRQAWYAVAAGGLLGLSTYTYSTARLLSFIVLLSLCALYAHRRDVKLTGLVVVSAAVTLIPYLIFYLRHPGALTLRFQAISYVYNQSLSTIEKLELFFENYFQHSWPRLASGP